MKKIKTKLYIGLGLMLIITSTLFLIGMNLSERIAKDSEKILKNNYATVGYTVEMLNTLEEIYSTFLITQINVERNVKSEVEYNQTLDSLKKIFEFNLTLQQGNITEKGEQNLVNSLTTNYHKFIKSIITNNKSESLNIVTLNYLHTKDYLTNIYKLNFNIIEDKNKVAQDEAFRLLNIQKEAMLLGFFVYAILFVFLPMIILNPIDKLSETLIDFYKEYFDKDIIIKEDNEIKVLSEIFDKVVHEFKEKREEEK
jgi:NtrC-family two-component system sensor histidine kinase KinB